MLKRHEDELNHLTQWKETLVGAKKELDDLNTKLKQSKADNETLKQRFDEAVQRNNKYKIQNCKLIQKYESQQKKMTEESEEYKTKMEYNKKEIDQYKKEMALYNGTSKTYHALDLERVNKLEMQLRDAMKEIRKIKYTLIENGCNEISCNEKKEE